MLTLLPLFLCITAGILVYVATKKISLALLTVVVLLILTYLGVMLEYARF